MDFELVDGVGIFSVADDNVTFDSEDGVNVGDGMRLSVGKNGQLSLVTVSDTTIEDDGVKIGDARVRGSVVRDENGKIATDITGFAKVSSDKANLTFLDGVVISEFSTGEDMYILSNTSCSTVTDTNTGAVSWRCDKTDESGEAVFSVGGGDGLGSRGTAWDGSIISQSGEFKTNTIEVITLDGYLMRLSYEGGLIVEALRQSLASGAIDYGMFVVELACKVPATRACYADAEAVFASVEEGDYKVTSKLGEVASGVSMEENRKRAVEPAFEILLKGGNYIMFNGSSDPEDAAFLVKQLSRQGEIDRASLASGVPDCIASGCVQYMLSGGVSTNEATITVKLLKGNGLRVVASATGDFEAAAGLNSTLVAAAAAAAGGAGLNVTVSLAVGRSVEAQGLTKLRLTHLIPDTRYEYRVEVDGELSEKIGVFRTLPVAGSPASFSFLASCNAGTGSAAPVFTAMGERASSEAKKDEQRNLFFLHMGDMHDENIDDDDEDLYRNAYHEVFSAQAELLYEKIALTYMWDDHDFGPDNANALTANGRRAARQVYREFVPHHPLVAEGGEEPNAAIYHSFTVGRVLFIMTDLRSEANPSNLTMMGYEQRFWFEEQVKKAGEDDAVAMVVWLSTVPWIGEPTREFRRKAAEIGQDKTGGDIKAIVRGTWMDYIEEREVVAAMLRTHLRRKEVLIMGGNMGAVAFDDGSNSAYWPDAKAEEFGPYVLHAGPLSKRPDTEGGPYSHGCVRVDGAYVEVTIVDDDPEETPCFRFQAFDGENDAIGINWDSCTAFPGPGASCSTLPFFYTSEMVGLIVGAVCLFICSPCCAIWMCFKAACCCFKAPGKVGWSIAAVLTCGLCGSKNKSSVELKEL
jgi:alkaline phosphatase D